MSTDRIMLSQREVRILVMIQSVLVFGQVVTAAGALGDIVGGKQAALLALIVAGLQQATNFFLSKSVGDAVTNVQRVVTRAESVTTEAHELLSQVPQQVAQTVIEHNANKQEE